MRRGFLAAIGGAVLSVFVPRKAATYPAGFPLRYCHCGRVATQMGWSCWYAFQEYSDRIMGGKTVGWIDAYEPADCAVQMWRCDAHRFKTKLVWTSDVFEARTRNAQTTEEKWL